MELSAKTLKRRLNEIELAGGDATGDDQQVGIQGFREGSIERCGVVGSCGQNPGLAAGRGNQCGEHRRVTIANLPWAGRCIDRYKLIARGQDGHSGANEDFEG